MSIQLGRNRRMRTRWVSNGCVSIRLIAERVGVTEGALYRHFTGKDDPF